MIIRVVMCLAAAAATVTAKPVKVFIMAGQSNMDGQAEKRTIDFIGEDPDPARAALLKTFKPDGTNLVTRSDVWVANPGVYDILQPGFGGRNNYNALGSKIGPEYAFGYYMGEAFDEPVLLIKYGPGGQTLYQNFRPPSAGVPDGMTAGQVGEQYRAFIGIVHDTLDNLKTRFPAYDEAEGYEIAGFVWFQGYNDMVSGGKLVSEYAANLTCLINDLRTEFVAPDMKAVVGIMGVNGVLNEGGKQGDIRNQMRSINSMPEFTDNAKAIETAPLLHPEIVAIKTAGWLSDRDLTTDPITPDEQAMLDRATSNLGFHYFGEGRFFILLGKAFAETMLDLFHGLEAGAQRAETVQNFAKAITLGGRAAGGGTLSYAIASGPAHGTLTGLPPDVNYTPFANYVGTDSFTFTVSNGQATSAAAGVNIVVSAADGYWSNPAGGQWSVGGNWSIPPASSITAALTFSVPGTYTCVNDRSETPFILNRITFENPTVTLLGGDLQLAGTAPTIYQNSSSPIIICTNLYLAATTTFTGTGSIALTGTLTGTGLTKTGLGSLSLSGASTLAASLSVTGGALDINGGSMTAGAATFINGEATVTLGNGAVLSDSQFYIGDASNNNAVTVTGVGSRLLRGAYPGSGTHRLYLGMAGGGGQGGTGNSLTIANGGYVYSGGDNSNRSLINSSNNTVTITGTASEWFIAGNDLRLGSNAGSVGNNMLIQNGGLLTIKGSQAVMIGPSNGSNDNAITVTGADSLWNMNTSSLTIGSATTSTGNCANILNGGTLQYATATPAVSIVPGNAVNFNGATLAYKGVATGVYLTNNTLGSGVGLFTWAGSNTFRLDGSTETGTAAYSFGGTGTTYSGLELYGTAKMPNRAITLDGDRGATLLLADATASNNLSGGITLAGSVTVTASGTASILTGVVAGSGALTKSGAAKLTFGSTSAYSGDTTVSMGTLKLTSANPNNQASAVSIAASGAILELGFTGTDTVDKLFIGGSQMTSGVYGASGSGAAIIDNTRFAGAGTLTVTTGPTGYASWAAGLVNPAFDADSDHNGLPNGLQWILGGAPIQNHPSAILPAVTGSAATGLTIVFKRLSASIAETTLMVEWGGTPAALANSLIIGASDINIPSDHLNPSVEIDAPSAGQVTVTIPASRAVGGKLFTRLKATQP